MVPRQPRRGDRLTTFVVCCFVVVSFTFYIVTDFFALESNFFIFFQLSFEIAKRRLPCLAIAPIFSNVSIAL